MNYQGIFRIRVKVYDNRSFIENTDFITQFILRQIIKELGTPVLLDNIYLNCTFEELEKAVLDGWEKYKSKSV